MAYPIQDKLVVAVASSALFDLTESDAIFTTNKDEKAYRAYQRERENEPLKPGVAFPFIKRFLALNRPEEQDEPVEVILLSKNDPDTGLRVMNSMEEHGLPISRAAFLRGNDPFRYIDAFNACLFLSADQKNVDKAVRRGLPAGRVLASKYLDDDTDHELRVAFDCDGVVIDDEPEQVFQDKGLEHFHQTEAARALEPHNPGPLKRLLEGIGKIHQRELDRAREDSSYRPVIRLAIVTARNAPAHKRLVTTLRAWGIEIDEAFFLGGMDKARILAQFKPHIFFDDQLGHVGPVAEIIPSVHVPFGVKNRPQSAT